MQRFSRKKGFYKKFISLALAWIICPGVLHLIAFAIDVHSRFTYVFTFEAFITFIFHFILSLLYNPSVHKADGCCAGFPFHATTSEMSFRLGSNVRVIRRNRILRQGGRGPHKKVFNSRGKAVPADALDSTGRPVREDARLVKNEDARTTLETDDVVSEEKKCDCDEEKTNIAEDLNPDDSPLRQRRLKFISRNLGEPLTSLRREVEVFKHVLSGASHVVGYLADDFRDVETVRGQLIDMIPTRLRSTSQR
jgi:hypothetical protein